jgi:hypothetical protein
MMMSRIRDGRSLRLHLRYLFYPKACCPFSTNGNPLLVFSLKFSLTWHRAIDSAISLNSGVKDSAISLLVTGKVKCSYTTFKNTNKQPQRLLRFVLVMHKATSQLGCSHNPLHMALLTQCSLMTCLIRLALHGLTKYCPSTHVTLGHMCTLCRTEHLRGYDMLSKGPRIILCDRVARMDG